MCDERRGGHPRELSPMGPPPFAWIARRDPQEYTIVHGKMNNRKSLCLPFDVEAFWEDKMAAPEADSGDTMVMMVVRVVAGRRRRMTKRRRRTTR